MILELAHHKFEHLGTDYLIIGMQGGKPLRVQDIRPEIPMDEIQWSLRAYGSGYIGMYGVNDAGQLALKKVSISATWEKDIHQVVPMTGYILFSNLPGLQCFEVDDKSLLSRIMVDMRMFEAEIIEGVVTHICDCAQEVETRLMTLNARLKNETDWDWTTHFLPRRYELLAHTYYYICYPESMPLRMNPR